MKYQIYLIENLINHKKYIGQTNNFIRRKRQHINTAFKKWSNCDKPLYKAFRKYGIKNFSFNIIDEADTLEEINQKEIDYIQKYKSSIDLHGYNLDLGGNNGHKSEYVRKKIGDAQKGKLNHAYGKRFELSWNSKQVINLTDNIIYSSARECAFKEYGDIKYAKSISSVCNPNNNKFTYKGKEYRLFIDGKVVEKKMQAIPLCPKRIKETFSNKIYNSIEEASKDTGLSTGMIRDRIYHRIKNDKYKDIYNFILQ